MRKHINDDFFGLQPDCQLSITVTDVGQLREYRRSESWVTTSGRILDETHRGGVFSEKKNSPLDASRLSVVAILFMKVILMIGSL